MYIHICCAKRRVLLLVLTIWDPCWFRRITFTFCSAVSTFNMWRAGGAPFELSM